MSATHAAMTTPNPSQGTLADSIPRTFEALRNHVIERHGMLPKRLAQVAKFALDHPDEMALNTVAELSAAAGVQPSALVRFAQSLGYSGFSELQGVFRSRLRDRWPDYQERLTKIQNETGGDADSSSVLGRFVETSMRSLARLPESISGEAFDAAVSLLARARTIYILGQRRVFPVAAYLSYMFGKLEMQHVLLDNFGSMIDIQAGSMRANDVLLVITFTPYTPVTVEIANQAAARGVPLVAITDSVFSPIASLTGARLEVVESDLGSFRCLTATLTLAMGLAVVSAERRRTVGESPSNS
ncbi:sugar isomerase [Acidocella aquatica]|uniref:Sugar isomerase n=1 Tax=Acidocella aquatica TaxID=1922313 RepID=A0ABQ6AAM9_9PROT|nr:MurR/RpiR family transcriptional regulator [Acidocella aquatica]GLR67130.1 sugar isomerase [Acidocella aquatica]